jgi:hypothetical protein
MAKLAKNDARIAYLDPPCSYCVNLLERGFENEPFEGWTCKAFPEGIPRSIIIRDTNHNKVLPGQTGDFIYEPQAYNFDDGMHFITFDGKWIKL